jgi:glycopeptide antibiotics resistance protein
MLEIPEPPAGFSARRALRGLLVFYSLLIVYGSFLPYHFNLDPNFVEWRWRIFVSGPLLPEARHFMSDVISNILLFAPWGFLWVAVAKGRRTLRSPAAPLLIGALGLLFGLSIECGQTLSPFRSPSKLDALCNGAGAALGAAFAYFIFGTVRKNRGHQLRRLLRERPSLFLLALLLLALLFEAAYPFRLTLDIAIISARLKHVSLSYPKSHFPWLWQNVWIPKILFFAAVAYLTRQNLRRPDRTPRSAAAWLLCSLLALVLEGIKLLGIGRVPNSENILFGCLGALLGVSAVPKLASLSAVQKFPKESLLLVAIGLLVYSELVPFDWIPSSEALRRMGQIESMPFKTYYYMVPSLAAFDIAKKLFLSIPSGFILAARSSAHTPSAKPQLWRATATGTILALTLEIGQIWLRSRTPSVTDVLLIGFGSWLGAVAFESYREMTHSPQPVLTLNDSESP